MTLECFLWSINHQLLNLQLDQFLSALNRSQKVGNFQKLNPNVWLRHFRLLKLIEAVFFPCWLDFWFFLVYPYSLNGSWMLFTTERKKRGYEWRWWPRKRDNAFLLRSLKRGIVNPPSISWHRREGKVENKLKHMETALGRWQTVGMQQEEIIDELPMFFGGEQAGYRMVM